MPPRQPTSRPVLRKAPAPCVFESPLLARPEEPLALLLEERFYEILDAGQWWGASVFAGPDADAAKMLRALALAEARAACLPARAGAAGYVAIVAHPCDSALWPTRLISPGAGWGKRAPAPAGEAVFRQLGRADFPSAPQSLSDNEESARAAICARLERAQIELSAGAGPSSAKAKRL